MFMLLIISRADNPAPCSRAAFFAFSMAADDSPAGLPPFLPLARAAVIPAMVFSTISSRMNSEREANILKVKRPVMVVVLRPSFKLTNSTSLVLNSSIQLTRSLRERPNLYNFQTTNISPCRNCANICSNSGRSFFLPDFFSW